MLPDVPLLHLLPACISPTADEERGTSVGDERFDRLLPLFDEERLQLGAPGAAVGILDGGELAWTAAFGSRDEDGDEPVTPDTMFRIGSLTKGMTALAFLRQVDAGRAGLDDPLDALVPDLEMQDPAWIPAMTPHLLLSHQAGIVDYLQVDGEKRDGALAEFFEGPIFRDQFYVNAPPGSFYNYSNSNYTLAGYLLERLDGRAYPTLMDEDVFEPLGMERTAFKGADVEAMGDYAVGRTVDWETGSGVRWAGPNDYDNAWGRPAGFIWSDIADLSRYAAFLMEGDDTLLSPDLWAQQTSPQVDTDEAADLQFYGYGLQVSEGFYLNDDFYDTPLVTHGGALNGFSADLYLLPETGFGVITLASTDGAYFREALGSALAMADLPAPSTGPDLSPDPSLYPDLAGSYNDPWNVGRADITYSGGDLTIDFPDLDALGYDWDEDLVPISPDNYALELGGFGLVLTAIRGPGDEIAWLRTRSFVLTPDDDAPPNTSLVPPDPLTLQLAEREDRQRAGSIP